MKLARSKNASRNIFFGVLYRCITIIFPFMVRTVMLHIMGTEYVGLDSLFTSILNFLNIAELGVGSALVYSMYKPIAEDDSDTICALLNMYKKLYKAIGLIVLVVGLFLVPFLRFLVKGDCPNDVNFYILYFVFLLNSVLGYEVFAYKQSILLAFQRTDIISKCMLVFQLIMYVLQLLALFLFRSYYLYIILLPICTVLINVATTLITDKFYPQYQCRGNITKDNEKLIKKKIKALFGTKVSSIVLHASDNIIISLFLDLSYVAMYGNYYYIMNAVLGLTTIIYNSLVAGIGNSLVTESSQKNIRDFNNFSFINYWITMFSTVCLVCLYQPFMYLWAGEDLLFGFHMVVFFAVYFYIYQSYRIVLTYKDAAGVWWEDRYRPYVVIATNFIGNILLFQVVGIEGVILSTILSLLVSVPWATLVVFKHVVNVDKRKYFITLFRHFLTTGVICIITYKLCEFFYVPGVLTLFIRLLICIFVPNAIYIIIYRNTDEFEFLKRYVFSLFRIKKS